MQDDRRALNYACPNCNSAPGRLCTEPTISGRKSVRYIHFARTSLVADNEEPK